MKTDKYWIEFCQQFDPLFTENEAISLVYGFMGSDFHLKDSDVENLVRKYFYAEDPLDIANILM